MENNSVKSDSGNADSPRRPLPAPVEFAGQWVAWNSERTEIIAQGTSVAAVRAAAIAAGQPDALLQKVSRPDQVFVGRL
jgi:hypothetical protein